MPQPMLTGGCVSRRILPFLLLAVTACASGAGPVSTTATIPGITTTSSAPASIESTASTEPATTTTQAIDAATVVRDGIEASSSNYRFMSTVMIEDETITTIDGVVDNGSVSATIATGAQEVSYVRTSEGEWVTDAGGDWVDLEGEPPVTPPLGSLDDPRSLEVTANDGDIVVITGVLGPVAGEAEGVEFAITIADGLVSEISYQANSDGQTAVVTTRLSDVGAAGAVSPPDGV